MRLCSNRYCNPYHLDAGDGVLNNDDNNFIIPDRCLAISDSDIVDGIYGHLIREKRYEELANSLLPQFFYI